MTLAADPALQAQFDLEQRIDELARAAVLLVASDFDGTLAPIVLDPATAEAERESLVALQSLARMPQTHVAIISGRALADLAERTREVGEAHLIGSHGSEFEAGFAVPLDVEARALHQRLIEALRGLSHSAAGLVLEIKPASLAFHYRNADPSQADEAVHAILCGPATWPGVFVRHGKKVIELSVVDTDKGTALRRVRQHVGASAVLFVGDDVTDEDAFLSLTGPDLGIKVGPGPTSAAFRCANTIAGAQLLARLAHRRAEWLAGARSHPIERHALLSDQRTIALLDPAGRVVWMCLPRIDSPAIFAELLGGPAAGFFDVRPANNEPVVEQRYDGDSFVLETRWPGMRVVDYLDSGGGRAYQRAGRTDLIRVVEGTGKVRAIFAPRLDFGRMETRLSLQDSGVVVEGTIDPIVLRAPQLAWRLIDDGRHHTAIAEFELGEAPAVFELRYGTSNLAAAPQVEPARRERTLHAWSGWAATLRLPLTGRAHVLRSALVLRALCYGPTGAIAAAATTSLPEHAGGVRNWDYRFCWPRDAAMAATALLRLGASGPALKLLDWLLGLIEHLEPPALLSPLYTVTGGHVAGEGEVGELAGYCGSRPVRIGNAAAHQVQLDVFGPIVELVALLAQEGAALSSEHWRLVETMVAAVGHRWSQPDHGIWEVRRPRQHHVHSKVMCWQAVDRAQRVASYLGRNRPEWSELSAAIAADVLRHGWSDRAQAYGGTYESGEADAAALLVGLSGLLAAEDPRFASTVRYVEESLLEGPVVYRYRYDDGLPGVEGGFLLCTTWLIEAYVRLGRLDEARALFGQYVALAGPTGLLAEEFDPHDGRALGNFPQAYSHVGLINAALAIEAAEGPPLASAAAQ